MRGEGKQHVSERGISKKRGVDRKGAKKTLRNPLDKEARYRKAPFNILAGEKEKNSLFTERKGRAFREAMERRLRC